MSSNFTMSDRIRPVAISCVSSFCLSSATSFSSSNIEPIYFSFFQR
nr:MAG TPA_asm: hypothetical protein [Caudoviricetes sp.]